MTLVTPDSTTDLIDILHNAAVPPRRPLLV